MSWRLHSHQRHRLQAQFHLEFSNTIIKPSIIFDNSSLNLFLLYTKTPFFLHSFILMPHIYSCQYSGHFFIVHVQSHIIAFCNTFEIFIAFNGYAFLLKIKVWLDSNLRSDETTRKQLFLSLFCISLFCKYLYGAYYNKLAFIYSIFW